MIRFFVGVVVGIMVATVGFSGFVRAVDNGVNKVQNVTKEVAQ